MSHGKDDEPQSDPDRLPDSCDPTGPCPRCGRVSNFSLAVDPVGVTFRTDIFHDVGLSREDPRIPTQQVAVLECGGCKARTVVVEDQYSGDGQRHKYEGRISFRGFHWWPAPGSAGLSPAVPTAIADAYGEGQRCISASAPNGATAMFRTALAYIVGDKGSAEAKAKGDLKQQLKQMAADPGPVAGLADWMDHIRLYGNAGAHPDLFGGVTIEEARDIASLTYSLLELLYIIPSAIAKRQTERRS